MENIVAVMDNVLQGLCNVCKSTVSISQALSVSKKEYVMHLMMFEIHYAQKYDFFGDWIMCLRYSCYSSFSPWQREGGS